MLSYQMLVTIKQLAYGVINALNVNSLLWYVCRRSFTFIPPKTILKSIPNHMMLNSIYNPPVSTHIRAVYMLLFQVLRNVDELFQHPELSAVPEATWTDVFNSGVMVIKPSTKTFKALKNMAKAEQSYDGKCAIVLFRVAVLPLCLSVM